MDIKNSNTAAHADTTDFPIGDGRFRHLPTVAKGVAVTAAARKLVRGVEISEDVIVGLPDDEALAIAGAVVDPTQLRLDIERKRYSLHQTPSQHMLVSLQADVWSSGVSCDGRNGRARLDATLSGGKVWPAPLTNLEPTLIYRTRSLERLSEGAIDNAKRISSPDMRTRLREHPQGVWNPIFVVPARAEIQAGADEPVELTAAFMQVIEGSTRVVTSQEGAGVSRGLPVEFAGNTLDLNRRFRAALAGRLVTQPDSADVEYAVKLAKLPANIIIGVLDKNGQPATTPYREVIEEFVQSIHEEPRPWVPIAQGGVRGERLVRDLIADGRYLTAEQGADIVGGDDFHEVTTPLNVIAGRLLRATTHPDMYPAVRRAILEDTTRKMLTRKRYAQTVGSLMLTVYREVPDRQKNRVAALTGGDFEPAGLKQSAWSVREDVPVREVLQEALAHIQAKPGTWSPAAAELVARSVGALATLGLVFSDQGSQVSERQKWLRGSVAKVVNGLATCAGGLKILCEAAEKAEDASLLWPQLYDADGNVVVGEGGGPERLHPDQGANLKVRALANRDQKPADEDFEDEDVELTPRELFIQTEKRIAQVTGQLEQAFKDLQGIEGEDGQPLVQNTRFDREIMADLPVTLIYVRDEIMGNLEPEVLPIEELDHADAATGLSIVDEAADTEEEDDNPAVGCAL